MAKLEDALVAGKAALKGAAAADAGDYPAATAFAFRVVFGEGQLKDETSFQEVSGIGAEMQVEEVEEGGETRYVHRLPKGIKHNPLVLKRGIGPAGSPLVRWCRATLEGGLGRQIQTVSLSVYLLDAEQLPLRAWLFADAYPTHWEFGAFDAMKNELAIETIKLSYTYSNRIL
jgi:phage tail-like protein